LDGKKIKYVYLLGWNGEARKIEGHGFNADGKTHTSEWNKLSGNKWTGHGSGLYRGEPWKSAATLEFKENWQRYKDSTDGKPWIAVFTRKTKAAK
jgi:hypothetical protein